MKTLFYLECKTPVHYFMYERIFRLYLKLCSIGYSTKDKCRVYDHLGMIDTLGHDTEVTKFTRHYSDELTSIYAVKLFFSYNLEIVNGCGYKEINISKNNITLY